MNEHFKGQVAETNRVNPGWSGIITECQWRVYHEAIRITRKTGARFLIGGAFALAGYTGRCRNTKDLDFFVLPSEKDRIVDALTKAGFEDYFPVLAYDREWIYRATKDDVLVDTIWRTPNRRASVDQHWFTRAKPLLLKNEPLEIVPAEELLAIKLYVMQRDRCDWPDLLNLLYSTAHLLDWSHVIQRMGPEKPLLAAILNIFNWIAPDRAMTLPPFVREEFSLAPPTPECLSIDPQYRINLLDTRPWFAAFQPEDQPLVI